MSSLKFSKFEKKRDLAFLEEVLGTDNLSIDEEELLTNASDAFPGEWVKPDVIVWPANTQEVSRIVKYANDRRLPITPRGAGSSLSGNVTPIYHGIVMNFRRMKNIVEISNEDLQVRVQPGAVYDEMNAQLQPYNLFFPPDPSSSSVCTIGGMVANNASGLGAVKYGVTRDYVLGLEVVLADGRILRIGSKAIKSSVGYDLASLFIGSEGTLGVITQIVLRLRTLPQTRVTAAAYFDSVSAATDSVSEIMRSGLRPAAIEFLDRESILAVNRAENLGLREADAMLLLEVHGMEDLASRNMKLALEICRRYGAAEIHEARDEAERKRLWTGRKGVYPSFVRSARSVIVGDIVVPISKITEMLAKIYSIAGKYDLRIACLGHAGDGNVHPNILTDRSDSEHWIRAMRANEEIVVCAIKLGGVASGEHGIGTEKKQFMQLQHGESLDLMRKIKTLLDPNWIMNPGKFMDT
jgi:glycolate oxidase